MLASRLGTAMVAALLWPSIAAAQARIDSVAWMQGCRQLTDGDRVVEEHWTSSAQSESIYSSYTDW